MVLCFFLPLGLAVIRPEIVDISRRSTKSYVSTPIQNILKVAITTVIIITIKREQDQIFSNCKMLQFLRSGIHF